MVQLSGDLRLCKEPTPAILDGIAILRTVVVEHFHRHATTNVTVGGTENHAHTASADLLVDVVASKPLRLGAEARQQVCRSIGGDGRDEVFTGR